MIIKAFPFELNNKFSAFSLSISTLKDSDSIISVTKLKPKLSFLNSSTCIFSSHNSSFLEVIIN